MLKTHRAQYKTLRKVLHFENLLLFYSPILVLNSEYIPLVYMQKDRRNKKTHLTLKESTDGKM